jgi:3-dehydroquinate dehydratase
MKYLKIKIVKYVDDSQPGWVKCVFEDVQERQWSFVEKAPIVTSQQIGHGDNYPLDGEVECSLISEFTDSNNNKIVTIDLSSPLGIEAENGQSKFNVFESQIKNR